MLVDLKPRITKPGFSDAEVDWAHPLADRLALFFMMNEGGGTLLYDSAISRRRGTVNATITWVAGSPPSLWALRHGGTLDTLSVTFLPTIATGTNYTIDCRFRLNSVPAGTNEGPLLGNATPVHFAVAYNLGAPKLTYFATSDTLGATTLTTGTWFHGAVTVAGTAVTLYLNGISDGTGSNGLNYTASSFFANSFSDSLTGDLEYVRLWSRVLPAQQILWLSREPYAMVRPRPAVSMSYKFIPTATGGGAAAGPTFDHYYRNMRAGG